MFELRSIFAQVVATVWKLQVGEVDVEVAKQGNCRKVFTEAECSFLVECLRPGDRDRQSRGVKDVSGSRSDVDVSEGVCREVNE